MSFFNKNAFRIRNRANGFTLAEVLITLGIIGIVAAMTLPTLVAKYQEKVLLTRVKRTYALIFSAINTYKAEKEVFDVSGLFNTSNTSQETMKNFAKYFKTVEICEKTSSKDCQGVYYIKPSTKAPDGNGQTATTGIYYRARFVLTDGSIIGVTQYSNCYEETEVPIYDDDGFDTGETKLSIRRYCALLAYDVNGREKPNQAGRDYFCFGIKEDGSIYDPKTSNCGNITSVLAEDKLNDVEFYNIGSYK